MNGLLCYDATCPFCVDWVRRLLPWLRRWGVHPRAIQARDIAARLGLAPGEVGIECRFIRTDGRVAGGGDLVAELAEAAGNRGLARVLRWRVFRLGLRWAYRRIEARWHCQAGVCRRRERFWGRELAATLWRAQGERIRHGWG